MIFLFINLNICFGCPKETVVCVRGILTLCMRAVKALVSLGVCEVGGGGAGFGGGHFDKVPGSCVECFHGQVSLCSNICLSGA